MLSQMPPVHRKTFKFLVSFKKELVKHSDLNGLDPKILGRHVCMHSKKQCVC